MSDFVIKDYYLRRIRKLRKLLGEFVNSPVVLDDERLNYVEIQVPKRTVAEARRALGLEENEKRGEDDA